MIHGIISRRYASALWMYAQKNGQEDRVFAEVRLLNKGFTKYEALKRVLSNRFLSQNKKIDIITMVAGKEVSNVFKNFIRLLFANNREEYLRTICLSFETIYLRERKILKASIVTAIPIDKDTEQHSIEKLEKLSGHAVQLNTAVNPAILGGCVITLDTWRLDASVATKLKRIKESLLETAINF